MDKDGKSKSSLFIDIEYIFFRDDLEIGNRICFLKNFRELGFRAPIFVFKCLEYPIFFLDVIDLLLSLCPPKIHRGMYFMIEKIFSPLKDAKILPQCSYIGPRIYGCKIPQDRIADTEIHKIDLLRFFELISEISRK